MKYKPPYIGRDGIARCPVCGNKVSFLAYRTETQAFHVHQTAPRKWTNNGRLPKRLNAIAVTQLVCEGCAHPLGQPPETVIKLVLVKPKKRRRK